MPAISVVRAVTHPRPFVGFCLGLIPQLAITRLVRPWMLPHLARETHHHHASADGDRLALIEKSSVERYRALVARIYSFEAPVETACMATVGLDPGLVRSHLKARWLAADLEALGVDVGDIVPVTVGTFGGPAEALAWLWVVHRNTLLHGLVYRYLKGKLRDTIELAGAYLSAFEGRAGALMRELGDALDHAARSTAAATQIVAAANAAFRWQHRCYASAFEPRRPPAAHTTTPRLAA